LPPLPPFPPLPPEPPVPPPVPLPATQLLLVLLHTIAGDFLVQSSQVLPALPQVVLFALDGAVTQPVAVQQPLQFAGAHLLPPQEGTIAATKPIAAPSTRALYFIFKLPHRVTPGQ
jgi:hypothetical protein